MRLFTSLLCLCAGIVSAAEFKDHRLDPPKDLEGYFPFEVPASKEAWIGRRTELKQHLQVALGLFPLPEKRPLNPVIHGRRDMGDYSVEKVYFESFPGFFVTGNLYRPATLNEKAPGILCPHGHWPDGRFMDENEDKAKKDISAGAEEFLSAARSPLQARCVQLARMGCVVFHYDMLGYADSKQISFELAHKFAAQKSATPGGFFTAEAEGKLQGILGLQAWNGIRALDFMETLPDVDPKRLGVTGASGGGTQTFLLTAIDDRPAAAFPAVMVSTAMQGGCTCENASLLRIGTGNVEIAALFAPKALGMTCANDWTKEMATKGFPELQKLYALMGAKENTSLAVLTQFPHNYNHPSRVAMEQWFAKHLLNGAAAPPEKEFQFLTAKDLTVWDEAHPAPASGPGEERKVLAEWSKANQVSIEKNSASRLAGWKVIIRRDLESTGRVKWELSGDKSDAGDYFQISGQVCNETHREIVNATFLYPKNWNHKVVVWITEKGARGMFEAEGKPVGEIAELLKQGFAIAGPTLLYQTDASVTMNRRVANPRGAPAYTYGYNDALFARRIHDVLTVVKMVKYNEDYTTEFIALRAGTGGAKFVAVAGLIVQKQLAACIYNDDGFRFSKISDPFAADFLPGAVKYGDMDALPKSWGKL